MMNQLKKRIGLLRRSDEGPVCDSAVYCYGPLLDAVQMAHIFPDSKTFVDKKLKYSPGKIVKKFEELLKLSDGGKLSVEQIKEFVNENFDAEGLELELWTPEDWTPEPKFILQLQNPQLRGLARRINRLWKDLSRKIKDEVRDNPSLYSIIYVPNGFVIPGGRFREYYYWDTFWIVKALLHCDMTSTVKGILENFLLLVSAHGMVPNGGRVYYSKRSQPPFLTLMVREYMNRTAEVEFLRQHLPTLEREMAFWEEQRTVQVEKNGEEHRVFVFGTGGTGPRPESYREDVELAGAFEDQEEKEEFYFHMKAGAESGWDYSTRWMIDDMGLNKGGLKDVKTNFIVPVDLNCLMFMNYMNLSEFHSLLGDAVRAEVFATKAEEVQRSIREVLWSEEDKMWFDFDTLNNLPRKHFYPSNLFPLWAECYEPAERLTVAESAVQYLKKTGAIYCHGGVPTSLQESGQQWDFPNAWPPLQHILVAGLLKTEHSEARKMALTIARRYTVGTMFSCPEGAEVCNMFEKYDVNSSTGGAGGGGEYEVQTGFGWTNGVVIDFMAIFGDELLQKEEENDEFGGNTFKEQIELNTHFDTGYHKPLLLRKASNVFEKHELETSEKTSTEEEEEEKAEKEKHHPCLSIEEDADEGKKGGNGSDRLMGKKKMSVDIEKDRTKSLIALFERK